MRFAPRVILSFLVSSTIALPAALAGTISIEWEPVSDADLAGYRVYYGTSPGSYTQQQDVGIVTGHTLPSLTDCTSYYVAVKARDAAGNLSTSYSNVVSGWPRPVVTLAVPAAAERGLQLDVVITGTNFQTGAAVAFGNTGVTVNSVTVGACGQLVANVTVSGTAAIGTTSIDVTNPDLVYGTGTGLFTVQTVTPPTVVSTSPANGATGVQATVAPSITFSEAMRPSSVTAGTVRLLDASGNDVAQAAGSPALSGDGKTATLVPASSLAMGQTYKIQAVGGASGVKDLANNLLASTYTQATGFTIAADTIAPTISAVSSSGVGATTATITWTTNEASDSQVFYKAGETGYQQTSVDTVELTSHQVALTGLEPSTAYAFHVRSADAADNAATSSPDGSFTTSASSYSYIRFEAEMGTFTSPVRATSGTGVFRGAWIDTPAGTTTGSATQPAGRAEYGFHVPSDGTWYLWVRIYGLSSTNDSWFESVDGAARQQIYPSQAGEWKWTAGRSYTLTQGLHSLELGGRESETRADRILITNDPTFVPTEEPGNDVTAPQAPTSLSAAPSDEQTTLSWTNPTATDLASVIVRVRTDGRYPTSPADGLPVATVVATPGSAGSYVHGGLTNGTIYSYGVFAVDDSGNASGPAQVQSTAADVVPPAPVEGAERTDKHPSNP